MENPALPQNLKRTPSGYLFRKVIPQDLREIIGKTEIKIPCGKSYSDALANYHIESVKAQQLIDAARTRLQEQLLALGASKGRYYAPETYLKPITEVTPALVEQLRSLWLSGLEHDLNERAQGLDDDEFDELAQNIAEMQSMLGRAAARGQIEIILPSLHQLLHLRGYVLALRIDEERRLAHDFLTAVMEGYEVLKARHSGIRIQNPIITSVLPEFTPAQRSETEQPPTILTIGRIVDQFLEDYAKRKGGKEMLKKHQVALPILAEMVGRNMPITELRQLHINKYFEAIQRLPSRWPDVCRREKISVLQLLKSELLLSASKGMAPKTFKDSYRASISGFLRISRLNYQDEGFPTTITTEGIIYAGDREPGENAQRPMRLDEIKRLFESVEMREIAADATQSHFYWLVHIGLFSGARVNEVCQINPLVDIHQHDPSGIWYMRVTDDTPADSLIKKSTKNKVSKRNIPFHPKLLELGIIDYLTALREAGATRLFPGFIPKVGKASAEAERWFRRFIEYLGLRDETPGARLVGYHTFRSTILSEGQEREVDFTPITGHVGNVIVDVASESGKNNKQADKVIRDYQREMSVERKMARLLHLNFDVKFAKAIRPTVEDIKKQCLVD